MALMQLQCSACGQPVLDIPLLLSVAAQATGFPTANALLDYTKRHHPEWPRHYRTVTDLDGRRRVHRFILTSECRALVSETFRSTIRRDGRPKQARVTRGLATDASSSAAPSDRGSGNP